MAITPPPDPTPPPQGPSDDTVADRAARELRAAPVDPHWVDISSSIISSIRAATRRTWPIHAAFPAGSGAAPHDTLRISDQVLKTAVHRALAGRHGAFPTKVDLDIEGHRCIGAHLTITGLYGDILPTTGADIARLAADTLTTLLGTPIRADMISVYFEDITALPDGD